MKKSIKYKLALLVIIIPLSINTIMAQKKYDTIGRTILEYNTVYADFGPFNGRANLIEATIDHSVISLDGQPFMIFATPEFYRSKWWVTNLDEIKLIQRLVLQPSFQYEKLQDKFCELPNWIAKLKSLTYLKLNQLFIDRLDLLVDTEIKYLEFNNIRFRNERRNMLIEDIKKLKHLRGIAYDDSVPLDMVRSLEMGCVNCEFYLISDKNQKQKFMHDLNIDL